MMIDRLHDIGIMHTRPEPHKRIVGLASWALWMTLRGLGHPLGKGRQLAAISTMWAWQVWRRIVKRPIVVTLPDGSRLLCPSWSRLASSYVSYGFHEYSETLFVMDFLRADDVFIDVGANIGYYAVVAARCGSRVRAFEPAVRCARLIEQNALLNGVAERIELSTIALSDFNGTSRFNDVDGDIMARLETGDSAGRFTEVRVETLDSECQGLVPNLIKIDVEGYDLSVLKGAHQTLALWAPALLVEIWHGGLEVRQWLAQFGYRFYEYQPQERRLNALPDTFSGQATVIAIAQHALAAVNERLSTAPARRLSAPSVAWNTMAASF